MARSSQLALAQCRILAGVLVDEELNFRFEVWAYWRMSAREIERHYRQWSRQQDQLLSLKDQTVKLVTNFGLQAAASFPDYDAAADFGPAFFALLTVGEGQTD